MTDMGGTMRLGNYPCVLVEDSLAYRAYGKAEVLERHRHRFELNNDYRERLEGAGMRASGLSPDRRLVEITEVEGHPFMLGVQFHPEFRSRPHRPHPLVSEVCGDGDADAAGGESAFAAAGGGGADDSTEAAAFQRGKFQGSEDMKFFVDTADVDEVRRAARLGVVSGVTTNPSLAVQAGVSGMEGYRAAVAEIASIVDGPISIEVVSEDVEGMITEGKEYATWAPTPWVKLPSTAAGFEAMKALSDEGIEINQTLCFFGEPGAAGGCGRRGGGESFRGGA